MSRYLVMPSPAQLGTQIVTSGLVGHWDAGNSASYSGTGTTWTDLAGNSNGTLTNGPTYSTDRGGAIVFDGTNDFVNIPHVAAFVATNDFTMECVFYWDGVNATDGLLTKRAGSPVQQLSLFVNSENLTGPGNRIMVYVDGGAGVRYTSWQMPGAGLYHAQATMSATSLRLTVNGVFRAQNATAMSATYSTNAPFQIGNANGLSIYFANKIYLCRYYTRALNDTELLQNFNAIRGRFGL